MEGRFAVQQFGLTEREAYHLVAAFNGHPFNPRLELTRFRGHPEA